jgi:glycosyltransferase involved in cell wall biosynthesis
MLTIITITYDNYQGLIKTHESIKSLLNVEFIVINGFSDLETIDYLILNQIKNITEPDRGIADAFNKGIEAAQGNYVMFLNSGDILLDQTYIQNSLFNLEQNDVFFFTHANIFYLFQDKKILMKPTKGSLGSGQPYFHQTMIFRKIVFDIVGYFDLDLNLICDYDLIVRIEKHNLAGKYFNQQAVLMEGGGVSVIKEFESILLCCKSLKKHGLLNVINFGGFNYRLFKYLIRKLLQRTFGPQYLIRFKNKHE